MPEPIANTDERDRKYAWDYFQMHSSQRIATFNFYITLSTAVVGGMVALAPTAKTSIFLLPLSILLILLSFVFWKLDQRNKMLIKNSEAALKAIEGRAGKSNPAAIFLQDAQDVQKRRDNQPRLFWKRYYSYSDCFNTLFFIFGLFGVLGMGWMVWLLLGF